MQGLRIDSALRKNPEIARYLVMYERCRMTQLIQTEHSKGSGKSATRVLKMTSFPTGFGVLPYDGGIYDQPYRMMEFFEIFFASERNEAIRNLNS